MLKMRTAGIVSIMLSVIMLTGCSTAYGDMKQGITGLENPPFSDTVVLEKGERRENNYIIVSYNTNFSVDDISVVYEKKNVFTVELSGITDGHFVTYSITGLNPGNGGFYFQAENLRTDTVNVTVKSYVDTSKNSGGSSDKNTQTRPQSEKQELSEGSTDKNGIISGKDNSSDGGEQPQNRKKNEVYITPSGKRYHYSLTCAGKNGRKVTLSEAVQKGLTACKKCAGG